MTRGRKIRTEKEDESKVNNDQVKREKGCKNNIEVKK